jgi:hypothetical protein
MASPQWKYIFVSDRKKIKQFRHFQYVNAFPNQRRPHKTRFWYVEPMSSFIWSFVFPAFSSAWSSCLVPSSRVGPAWRTPQRWASIVHSRLSSAAQLSRVQRSLAGCSAAQLGCSAAQEGAAQLSRVQRSLAGCSAAQLGCSAAQWLVRWAAVRQPRVRFPPGTPPSAQQDELFTQTQEFIPSSGRCPAGEDLPEDEYCINVCLVRKIQNK